MKPIFKLLFTFFLCSFSSVIIAQKVNIKTAKTIAEHHLTSVNKSRFKAQGNTFRATSIKSAIENNDTLYYIVNDDVNKGFVIVSADQRAWPILAYSTEGNFDEKKQPEAFKAWMDNRKKEIEYLKKNNIQADRTTLTSWKNLSLKSSPLETKSVDPLIQTQWNQGCYYNSMCPADAAGQCGHALTGCTITAMAQIMKYWNFPTKGNGSHSYSDPSYGNLTADFGSTTYQWSEMPNSVTSQNNAVAVLMYHCGVSLNTEYGSDASSAADPRDELVQYFDYSPHAMLVNRSGYSTNDWINILKSELDLQHPIWYQGSGFIGHSFICDGYNNSNYFHFNWGWGGSSDGYFYIGNLNPAGFNFNENQYALINIIPGNLPDGYKGFFPTANFLDIATMGGSVSVDICSSTNWTASSDQSWLSLSTSNGSSGKTTLILTANENDSGGDRSAIITISAEGFSNQTITVEQLCKKNVTPGGLYSLVAGKANKIRTLALTGSIDARDFKTMRDAMPALTDIDLSGVTVAAYNGTEGTINSYSSLTYLANEIPANAFYIVPCQGRNNLKSIILPSSITSIEAWAFRNSNYLTSINISSSVNNIGDLAFELCSASVNVDAGNSKYASIDGVLFNKEKTKIIQCPTSKAGNYSIPSSVTSIEGYSFSNCNRLTSVIIPSSVTSIKRLAFTDNNGLLSVTIPSSVTSIEDRAFNICTA